MAHVVTDNREEIIEVARRVEHKRQRDLYGAVLLGSVLTFLLILILGFLGIWRMETLIGDVQEQTILNRQSIDEDQARDAKLDATLRELIREQEEGTQDIIVNLRAELDRTDARTMRILEQLVDRIREAEDRILAARGGGSRSPTGGG